MTRDMFEKRFGGLNQVYKFDKSKVKYNCPRPQLMSTKVLSRTQPKIESSILSLLIRAHLQCCAPVWVGLNPGCERVDEGTGFL